MTMNKTWLKRTITVGGVTAVLTATVAIAIAEVREEDPAPPGAEPTTESVDRETAGSIRALREKRDAGDSLPAQAAAVVAKASPRGANPSLSVKALSNGKQTLYLVPARDGVCLAVTDVSSGTGVGCDLATELGSSAATPSVTLSGCSVPGADGSPQCNSVLLYDVVPDGVAEVSVESSSAPPVTTPVRNNVYLVEVGSRADIKVVYESADGVVEQAVPVG